MEQNAVIKTNKANSFQVNVQGSVVRVSTENPRTSARKSRRDNGNRRRG